MDVFDWWVIGRAEKEQLILVECQLTGRLGTVQHFTKEQWDRAQTAAVHAYRWSPKWGEVLEMTATVA